jgi:hypothetical protein
MVGVEKRIGLVAEDFVKHWDARLEMMDGKTMTVCMSLRICYEGYEAIRTLLPEWHHKDDDNGVLKIVMTVGIRSVEVAGSHSQQAPARGAGEAVQESARPVENRACARHVADRLRRAQLAHDVCAQTNAESRTDAGHRAREPRLRNRSARQNLAPPTRI